MTNYMGSIEEIKYASNIPKGHTYTHSKELIADYLAKCTSVIYGKESKNPEKLLDRLMTEAVSYNGGRISYEEYKRLS